MIRPGVEYTREQIAEMRKSPEVTNLILRGYVLTLTLGGNFKFIPANQAAGGGYYEDKTSYGTPVQGAFDKSQLPKIVKRTPQQRVASLMEKVGEDLRFYLSGQAGRELSGEETREVASKSLQEAENRHEHKLYKQITRHED